MSFPAYPEYKFIHSQWLSEFPKHWELLPCRAIVEERTLKNEGGKYQNYLSLLANVGVLPYEEKGDIGNKKPEDLEKCKIVSKNDLVINSMNYGIGSYGLSAYEGVCSPVYIVMAPRLHKVRARFAFRVFENKSFQTFAQSFGNGILSHRSAINWDVLKNIPVAVPPLKEQDAILTFLDREIGKIDALIAEQEKLLTLLAEKHQATISHAVTRGINPNAPMKDSGIAWLGEVPEHWEVSALKYHWNVLDCKHITADFVEDGFPLASIREVQGQYVSLKDAKKTTFYFYNLLIEGGRNPVAGDLIFSRNATVGEVAQVTGEHPKFAMGQDVCLLKKIDNDNSSDYFQSVIRSSVVKKQIKSIMVGSTFKRINVEDIRSLVIPVPSAGEQKTIAAFVQQENDKFNSLIDQIYTQIDFLKERRSALIAAAVTGKIDVRNVVSKGEAA